MDQAETVSDSNKLSVEESKFTDGRFIFALIRCASNRASKHLSQQEDPRDATVA